LFGTDSNVIYISSNAGFEIKLKLFGINSSTIMITVVMKNMAKILSLKNMSTV